MILSVSLGVLVLLATGTYLLLSRDVFRVVVGISILGSAVNLVVFASGRLRTALPPIMQVGEKTLTEGANPLPQALVLTAIVIGFALTCFALVLCVTIVRLARTNDLLELTFAEPITSDGVKPPLEEDPPEGFSTPNESWLAIGLPKANELPKANRLAKANGLRERSGGGQENGLREVTGSEEIADRFELAGGHRPGGPSGRDDAASISPSRRDTDRAFYPLEVEAKGSAKRDREESR